MHRSTINGLEGSTNERRKNGVVRLWELETSGDDRPGAISCQATALSGGLAKKSSIGTASSDVSSAATSPSSRTSV